MKVLQRYFASEILRAVGFVMLALLALFASQFAALAHPADDASADEPVVAQEGVDPDATIHTTVVIQGVPGFSRALHLQRTIQQVEGVSDAKANGYERGILTLDVSEDELSRRREQWQPPISSRSTCTPTLCMNSRISRRFFRSTVIVIFLQSSHGKINTHGEDDPQIGFC